MQPDIVYIEDDIDYTDIVQHALNQIDGKTVLESFEDGLVALETLTQLAESKSTPKLILLDLNLPGLSGLDVLKHLKGSKALRHVPIVVFSTSDNPRDVRSSLEFGANAYVTKPLGYIDLVKCMTAVHSFWLKTAVVH